MRDSKQQKWLQRRIWFFKLIFILAFTLTATRALYLQVVKKEEWTAQAEKQHLKRLDLTPGRGAILDRNNVALATSVDMDSCFAEPKNIPNIDATAEKLAPILDLPKKEIVEKMTSAKNFTWLKRCVVPATVKKVKALKLPGIGFVKEAKRFYPNAETAAHVIGFMGIDPIGLDGIEKKYDSTIVGSTGYLVVQRDGVGRNIGTVKQVVKKSAPGSTVALTLDKNIQYIAEKELAKAVTENGAKNGIAIVMEPQTGKVLALANFPSYNPNIFEKNHISTIRNRAIADAMEPGSTFKTFLISAALEEKVVSPNDRFNCENGSYFFAGKTIHDTHKYGTLTVADVYKHSSNIGSAKIGQRLGSDRLHDYLEKFGFGYKTGIDLPGETSGILRAKEKWAPIDLANIAFGQGVTASAMQTVTAVSAIANNGVLMKPYLVDRILDNEGKTVQTFVPTPVRRVISAQTAQTMTRIMEGVTSKDGTGFNAAVEGYLVAGKTGTAQKVDPASRTYGRKRTASFVGFLPADDPKLAIIVVVDEPTKSQYGGVVAAPAFKQIAFQSLCYMKMPPKKMVYTRPAQKVETQPINTDVLVEEGVPVESEDNPAGTLLMPNLKGLSMKEVLSIMEKQKLNIRMYGSGKAIEQNPPPATPINSKEKLWVKFAPAA